MRQEPLRPGADIVAAGTASAGGRYRCDTSRIGQGPVSLRQEPLRPGAGIVATGAASARGRYRRGRNRFGRGPISLRQEPLRPWAGIVAAGTASAGGRHRCDRSRFGQGPVSMRQEPLRPGAGIVATGAASARGRIGYYVHTYQPGADSAGPVRVTESRILVCIPARCRPQIFGQAAGPVPRLWPVPRICAWTYLAFSFARRRLVRWSFVLTNHTG